jgi:hypothetical protein
MYLATIQAAGLRASQRVCDRAGERRDASGSGIGRRRRLRLRAVLEMRRVSPCCGAIQCGLPRGDRGKKAAIMEIIISNYPVDSKWAPQWVSGFSPFLSTLWQATTATKTAMVITARHRAQNQNRRRPEIIMVGSEVVITRIVPRTPLQPLGQTFRRLRHRPVRRRPARRSSLRLHLPQHRKRQREDLPGAAAEKNFAAAFVFVPKGGTSTLREQQDQKDKKRDTWSHA